MLQDVASVHGFPFLILCGIDAMARTGARPCPHMIANLIELEMFAMLDGAPGIPGG